VKTAFVGGADVIDEFTVARAVTGDVVRAAPRAAENAELHLPSPHDVFSAGNAEYIRRAPKTAGFAGNVFALFHSAASAFTRQRIWFNLPPEFE
jgi:hypothetical protein